MPTKSKRPSSDDLLFEPAGTLFGWMAWVALLVGPVLAWQVVFGSTPAAQCGDWGFDCLGRVIVYSAASWLLGTLLAIAALNRGERRGIAVPALVLNLLPLLGMLVIWVLIANRS